MLCQTCNTETNGILDTNVLWCDHCGTAMKNETHFVTGYCQSHSCRNQPYSRAKRFGKYIRKTCRDNISVLCRYHDILDLYSCFEFVWVANKQQSQRIYFFAKPVMLRCCCNILNIETNQLPNLKDKLREREQFIELMKLCNGRTWKALYRRRKFGQFGSLLHAAV
jgi:hypothetical protein